MSKFSSDVQYELSLSKFETRRSNYSYLLILIFPAFLFSNIFKFCYYSSFYFQYSSPFILTLKLPVLVLYYSVFSFIYYSKLVSLYSLLCIYFSECSLSNLSIPPLTCTTFETRFIIEINFSNL